MSGTDATRCKVCGGEFSAKRIIIDGNAYHQRCAVMSYPSHTHDDYQLLSDQHSIALKALEDLYAFVKGLNDFRADSRLGREVRAVLNGAVGDARKP